MPLKGTIETNYLSSILQLLCNDKKTGVLRVWDPGTEVRIYLKEGTIIYAMGSEKKHRLGYLLRSNGLISPEDLRDCLKRSQAQKQTLGKIMVEQKLISVENLTRFMYQKVQKTLYSLFLWKQGDFEFTDCPLNLRGHVVVELNTMELILEASRRADEKAALPAPGAPSKDPAEPEASPREKTLLLVPDDSGKS